MPKNKVKTIPVNKEVFMFILRSKNSSIRKLGAAPKIESTDKTIRRALNNGEMRPKLVDQIASYLNVESSLLTGEKVKKAFSAKNKVFKEMYLAPLFHLDKFPYFRDEQKEFQTIKKEGPYETGGIKETMKRILSLFDVSYRQFEEMTFEQQYAFQYELFEAMIPVMRKNFQENAYGETDKYLFEYILVDLDNYKEQHELLEFADSILRDRYIAKPPKGLTPKMIKKMTAKELLDFEEKLQADDCCDIEFDDPISKKYANYPLITEDDTDEDVLRKTQEARKNSLSDK